MILEAPPVGRELDMHHAFMGCAANAKHKFVFRRQGPGGTDFDWAVGLTHFDDSSMVLWPVELRKVPGYETEYVVFKPSPRPMVVPCFTWKHMFARKCRWRSPASQNHCFPDARGKWRPEVRLIVESLEKALLVVLAELGFCDIDVPTVRRAALVMGYALSSTAGAVEVLVSFIVKVLKCTEEAAMGFLQHRLESLAAKDRRMARALMEYDDAYQCLSKEDFDKVKTQKVKAAEEDVEFAEFAQEWKRMRVRLRKAAGAGAPAGGKGRGKGKGKLAPPPAPAPKPLPERLDMLDHSDVKGLCPPVGCRLWKSRHDQSWHTRMWEMPECSRRVATHGEALAIRMVVSDAWRQYALVVGLDVAALPVTSLEPETDDLD